MHSAVMKKTAEYVNFITEKKEELYIFPQGRIVFRFETENVYIYKMYAFSYNEHVRYLQNKNLFKGEYSYG